MHKTFTLRGLRSKEFFSAAVVGLSLAAAHIGYVVAFYVIATHVGAWAPQELNYQESVNTLFPWISGAAIGLFASTNEEFTFRLFAIPFFERFTKSRWIAVIVPAFSVELSAQQLSARACIHRGESRSDSSASSPAS